MEELGDRCFMYMYVCTFRKRCRTTVDDVDPYTHTRPEEIDLTPAEYDSIVAAPTRVSEGDTYTHVQSREIDVTPAEYDTIVAAPTRDSESGAYTHQRPG